MSSCMDNGDRELRTAVLFAGFGLSNRNKNFQPPNRDAFFKAILEDRPMGEVFNV